MKRANVHCGGALMVGCLVLAGSPACSTTRPVGTHETQVTKEAMVTVEAIDVPQRLVTVRDAGGNTLTVYVDESITSFPQAKVGDRVRIQYVASIGLRLAKPGEAGAGLAVNEETTRPAPGRPSAKATKEVKATVRIEAVEHGGSTVTFTGPRGRRTVSIPDAALRDYVKKLRAGDNVEVTYNEALALSLERVSGG